MNKDRTHILDELERFHQGKLDEVRAKRSGSKLNQVKEIRMSEGLSVRIEASQKRVVLSWE
jgi:hypothetical protein